MFSHGEETSGHGISMPPLTEPVTEVGLLVALIQRGQRMLDLWGRLHAASLCLCKLQLSLQLSVHTQLALV